jgi:DNA-binding response OmpR family regulator
VSRSVREPEIVVCDEPERIRELARRYPLVLAVLESGADVVRALDDGAAAVVRAGAEAELAARVRALLRRAPTTRLSAGERKLLACLASAPGRVFTKAELRAAIWGGQGPPAGSRALETQVARLRRSLGADGPALVTVWSVGYRLEHPGPPR